jgi:hypothetical protein
LQQNLGGNFLNDQALLYLKQECKYSLTPQLKVLRRKQMEMGKPTEPVLRKLQHVTSSYDLMAKRVGDMGSSLYLARLTESVAGCPGFQGIRVLRIGGGLQRTVQPPIHVLSLFMDWSLDN